MASAGPEKARWVESSVGGGITTETMPRHMKFVQVSTDELEDLKTSNGTVELALFGITAGALVALGTTIKTVELPDPTTKATFIALTVVCALASLYFGAGALRGQLRWRKKIEDLKKCGTPLE